MQVQLEKSFQSYTLHTGQHFDNNMSQIFFEELGIPEPSYMFDIGGSRPQGEQTGIMIKEIERVCLKLRPDALLIYGDTNSTLAGVLVAAKMCIPCIHIEAGLRSYNRTMPEEINRIIADQFSEILFCPTQQAIENLKKEGICHSKIFLSGDVMCDMLLMVQPKIQKLSSTSYYFATIHRPYNTDTPDRMKRILRVLNNLNHPVIFPIHPRTSTKLKEAGVQIYEYANIKIVPPVGYIESISYQSFSECVITDSGGMQKEAYMLRKKCITVRSETEWTETLSNGWNQLVFEDLEAISSMVLHQPGEYIAGIYGNGKAAMEIVERISVLI